MATQCPDPNLFVIFGGTGDLTRRKLLPALCRLAADGALGERCHVLAVTPQTQHDDDSYRALAREAGAKRMIPFHFSPRYSDREDALRHEAEATFTGTTKLRGASAI